MSATGQAEGAAPARVGAEPPAAEPPAAEPPAAEPPAAERPAAEPHTSAARALIRRWRWPAAVALLVVLAVAATVAATPARSSIPLAPDNADPDGARAVAQILAREGVRIEVRRTTAGALAATPPGGTIFVTDPVELADEEWSALVSSGADLVVTDVAFTDLGPLTKALETTGEGGEGARPPACDDPDAVAAGSVATGSGDVRAVGGAAVVCFPPTAGADTGAYAVVEERGRRITVLANSRPITNAHLAEAGNAALVLRMLGRSPSLTWFLPAPGEDATAAPPSVVPPAVGPIGAWAALVLGVVALWRGRRFGRLVVEPLPVVVPPTETTLGRARLYRRARAYGHAATALRAGSATRLARRLGVPAHAGADALVAALTRATGRAGPDLAALLDGPAPADAAGLLDLTRALDALEDEVAHDRT